MAVLAAENVSYTYQSKYQKVQALKNVSCTFEAGKFYAIIGQSGSGKTTLLSMLAGLGTPSEGEIIANGKTLKEIGSERHRRENVTVIYQSFNLFPTLNILENVMYPMQISKNQRKRQKSKPKSFYVRSALETLTQESCRRCSPAVSSSASPSHGHWHPTQKSSSRMNRRATSIRRTARSSLIC